MSIREVGVNAGATVGPKALGRTAVRPYLILIALLITGCVERRMTIRSIPAGAELYLDGVRIGETPATLPFTEYGVREIALRMQGYHVSKRKVEMEEPYFQRFPKDIYYEAMTKTLYQDHREYQFVLVPNTEEDLSRGVIDEQLKLADEMRKR